MRGLQQFHKRLQEWYGKNGRKALPWRTTHDAYAIYVSEIMLQQTQVQTVLERFYHPFLKRFPTLQSLADAPLDSVMKQWEGLGYYRRAGHLHAAAKAAAPALPQSVEGLLALPGIGQNTAHAVASFAYHQPVPVLEANVKRVVARIFALEQPTPNHYWEKAWELLNKNQPFDYNQAMMDLGSMICLPRAPLCGQCPASAICEGKTSPEAYPQKAKKKAIPTRKRQIIVWRSKAGAWYLAPREGKFLGGLYGFAEYPETADTVSFENVAYKLSKATKLGEIQQAYSHFKLVANVWLVDVGAVKGEGWFLPEEISALALSGADHKVLKLLS